MGLPMRNNYKTTEKKLLEFLDLANTMHIQIHLLRN